ncbi:MAG: hypothetical protein A3G88_00245 [Omnitrophica WOR_2 bacterium RIFCSPLOWO2_12_FULL_63_16]|nr:MAG: hypothetical protein A3G88_00245 [Omnitrophica WOR_2 bacterium RIFCSPLOWO2_12_FULL_63_16]
MRILCGIVLLLFMPSGISSASDVLTLEECYELALARSEELLIHQEKIREAEGRFLEALGTVMPTATFEWSRKRQDGNNASAFSLQDIPERKFVFTQPIFSGFKEFAALAASRAQRRERAFERRRAEHLLFLDVVDAFSLLRQQREDLATLEAIRLALVERLDELAARQRLGRSRPSDRVSAEARLRRDEAEIERVRRQEATARHLLEFLTGLPQISGLADDAAGAPMLDDEETCVQRAHLRPDVQAEEEAWRIVKHEVVVAQSGLWPDVDVEGNYYTRRVGNASGVDWDVLLKVEVPIFKGSEVLGDIQTASAKARQAKWRFEQVHREAQREIRDAYSDVQLAIARQQALDRAWKAAEDNYRLQLDDYRLNIVNNLDVLQTLQELQDVRRDLIAATYDVQRLYQRLRIATAHDPTT